MKRVLIILLGLVILIIGMAAFVFFSSESNRSPDQEQLIELWGYPDQFTISYLARGSADNPELVRTETWYYLDNEKSVSFYAGTAVSTDNFVPESKDIPSAALKPEDFNYYLSADDVADLVGSINLEPIDFLPVFFKEGEVETYLSPEAIFVVEDGHLTYMQTIGLELGEEGMKVEEAPPTTSISDDNALETAEELITYTSPNFGFTLNHPADWYLDYDVLTSYDSNYLQTGETLPESRLKCDFIPYNEDDASIADAEVILSQDTIISRGTVQDNSGFDGPGFGDSIMFLIEGKENSVAMLCFSYDTSFEAEVITMLESFVFNN